MNPFREIPRAILEGLEWLAFDVDDTVTDGGRLAPRSLDAMARLSASGVKLAAVTGRPLGWAQAFLAQWPIDLAIGENGAGYFARIGDSVVSGSYVDDESRIAAERARATALASQVAPNVPISRDGIAHRVDVAFDIAESRVADPADVQALEEALRLAGFRTVRSSIHLHASFADWDKARGIARAIDRAFGVSVDSLGERIVYVGDSANDEPVFETFSCTVGVANVRKHALRSWPRFVTEREGSEGFAEVAAAILSARETT